MRGDHVVKQWSRTQVGIALSSGEAELIALVKASVEGLGVAAIAQELGESVEIRVMTDSSAAKGAVQRTGSGRMKHVSTQSLWVQEESQGGSIEYIKVPRARNLADLMTHH